MTAALGRHAAMAVGAADLASRDLGIDGREAAAVPGEARDRCALAVDVIELEHQRVALAAVSARRSTQDVIHVSEVAFDMSRGVRARQRLRGRCPMPPGTSRGPSPVAVCAHHLAPRDVGVDRLARCGLREHHRDARLLLADVVELEDHGIGFAAINARVASQVIEQLRSQSSLPRQLGGFRLLSVCVAALPEIRGEARPAPPLQTIAEAVEALSRKVMAASAAAADGPRVPHAQTHGRHGVARSRRLAWCALWLQPADPHAHRRLRDTKLRAIRASDQPSSLRRRFASFRASSFLRTNRCSQRERTETGI
jgi:hypothetical protein